MPKTPEPGTPDESKTPDPKTPDPKTPDPKTPEPRVLPEDQDEFDLHLPMIKVGVSQLQAHYRRLLVRKTGNDGDVPPQEEETTDEDIAVPSPDDFTDEYIQRIRQKYDRIVGNAKDYLRQIRLHHGRLRKILVRHEEQIRKRWMKKNEAAQQAFLLKIYPRINAEHRPDTKKYRREFSWAREADPQETFDEHAYMHPEVNIEDLTTGTNVLRYLHSRGRYEPSAFVYLDVLSTVIGRIALQSKYKTFDLPTLCVDLRSSLAEGYGRVYATESERHRERGRRSGRLIPIGIAIPILSVQAGILDFLVMFCEAMLQDKNLSDAGLDATPEKPTPPRSPPKPDESPSQASPESWMVLAVECRQDAYINPEHGSFDRIRSLINARCEVGQDYILSLREDPSYFHGALLEAAEHCHDLLSAPGEDLSDRITAEKILKDTQYRDLLATKLMLEVYLQTILWQVIREQLDEVIRTEHEPERQADEAKRLTELILGRSGLFEYVRQKFISSFVACPGIRSNFRVCRRDAPMEGNANSVKVRRLCGIQPNFLYRWRLDDRFDNKVQNIRWRKPTGPSHKDLLEYLFADLMSDIKLCISEKASLDDASPVIDGTEDWSYLQLYYVQEFDRIILKDDASSDKISSTVAQALGDFGLMIELFRNVQYHFGSLFSEIGDHDAVEHISEETAEWKDSVLAGVVSIWARVANTLEDAEETPKFGELSNPSALSYPVTRARTQANHDSMRRAEANLDKLWSVFDSYASSTLPDYTVQDLRDLTPDWNTLERTGDWVPPPPKQQPNQVKKKDSTGLQINTSLGFSNVPFGGGSAQSSPISQVTTPTTPSKVKIKTKGIANPDMEEEGEPEEAPVQVEEPKFPVKTRERRVFETLFYQPDGKKNPGEVAWVDFLRAMHAIGFFPEKQYGSAWSFTPAPGMFGEGVNMPSIMFHEPHPNDKMDYRVARSIGHRLTRTYGLTNSSIIPAKGEPK